MIITLSRTVSICDTWFPNHSGQFLDLKNLNIVLINVLLEPVTEIKKYSKKILFCFKQTSISKYYLEYQKFDSQRLKSKNSSYNLGYNKQIAIIFTKQTLDSPRLPSANGSSILFSYLLYSEHQTMIFSQPQNHLTHTTYTIGDL